MRRRGLQFLKTLAVMAMLLAIAAVPAVAESELDQSSIVYNGHVPVTKPGSYQTVRTAKIGTLDEIQVLVACCGGNGFPNGDLKVTISAAAWPSSSNLGPEDAVAWISKDQFPEDNEEFKWVTAKLETPLPIQSTSKPPMQIALTEPTWTSGSPNYLWAHENPGSYEDGDYYTCYFWWREFRECNNHGLSATFKTYVTVGPDTVDPDTMDLRSPQIFRQGDTIRGDSASFTFSSDEEGATFECSLDNSAWGSCTSPKSYTGLSDGSHTVQVKAIDDADNYDHTPASFQFYVDASPPDTTITSTPSDPSDDDTPTFEFSSDDASPLWGPFECRYPFSWSGGNWVKCSSPHTISGVTESGTYTFEVRAVDEFNRPDPTPASYTWTFTAPPPDTNITGGPDEGSTVGSNSATFAFSSNQDGSTFECKLDDEAFESCASPKQYTELSDGSHTFEVKAIDSAGNEDPTPESRTWTVDATSPTIGMVSPENAATQVARNTNITATFSEEMGPETVNDDTVTLQQKHWYQVRKKKGKQVTRIWTYRWVSVNASVSCDNPDSCKRATLDPESDYLVANTDYTATVTTGAKDKASNALTQDYSWTFTTGSA